MLKDGTAIKGKWAGRDFDEENKDYKIILQDAERFFFDKGIKTKLHGDKIVINTNDCYFIEFKGTNKGKGEDKEKDEVKEGE